jgi:acetylornithine/succinyldiaminopimelate/putrescine aminotransferase
MSLIVRESNVLFHTYKRLPIEIERAEGMYIYTKDGNKYLDMLGGIAVNSLGHSNPKIIEAIEIQIRRYMHVSNFFYQDKQIEFAEKLSKQTGYSKVFLSNSGSESTEGSLKLARLWGTKNNKNEIVAFTGSFHGRTYGALSLMDKPKYKNGMGPFLPNIKVIEYNNVEKLIETISINTNAVCLEFIQGEGGVEKVSEEFVNVLKELKNKFNFLIMADEVQAGAGRTGVFNSFDQFNIKPDIIWLAKGIGGGLPLGAILANDEIASLWTYGKHGTTFGGNAVSCSAGIVVLDELNNGLMNDVKLVGNDFIFKLNLLKKKFPEKIKEVRGEGAIIVIEMFENAEIFVNKLLEQKIISNSTNGNVIRLLPPLIYTSEHNELFVNEFEKILLTN